MAELIWSEAALHDVDEIAEYIALENPAAARRLVQRVFAAVERLAEHPNSGRRPPELDRGRYREVLCGPCRIFYRYSGDSVVLVHVARSERSLRNLLLEDRNESDG